MSTEIDLICDGVLFDCDGVLVDSTDSGERAWTRWAGEFGLDPARVLDGVHGRRSTETVSLFLPVDLHAQALQRIEAIEIEGAAATMPIAGAGRLLKSMPANWAVVTSASEALVKARLDAAALPTPPVLITADDVTIGKPAPDGYLQAAGRLGFAIDRCAVVEDSQAGVRAGLQAKALHVVGVGERALSTEASIVVRDLTGIRWSHGALRLSDNLLRYAARP
jgi:mannitol-1-/sugar-/sorbitol-6-phosphatase